MGVRIEVEFYDVNDEVVNVQSFEITNALYISALFISNFFKEHNQEWFYYTIKKVEVFES